MFLMLSLQDVFDVTGVYRSGELTMDLLPSLPQYTNYDYTANFGCSLGECSAGTISNEASCYFEYLKCASEQTLAASYVLSVRVTDTSISELLNYNIPFKIMADVYNWRTLPVNPIRYPIPCIDPR
mmetsp:Transcript_2531/g.3690  ORF Transcript_2531/g.3690 Transcript_2531/m.3690 type:complete len:126 (+) Transcript_2531:1062-1439(+)